MNQQSCSLAHAEKTTAGKETYQHAVAVSPEQLAKSDGFCWIVQAAVSLIGLILFSPIFLLIALTTRLTSPGPIFYRGERVGRGKRIFKIYKFRTLIEGAEQKIGARLLSESDRDRLYTKIGRMLKRTKLDELPQLINVIRGEMRLVGPRPIRPIFLKQLQQEIPNYDLRFLVPPGITGIAQLRGGYYTSPRDKLRYDLIYIRNFSLPLDFKLVLLTFVKILNRWLSRGFFVLCLFLFVSFIPDNLQPSLALSVFGVRIGLVYLFIILLAAAIFAKKGPNQFSLYRSPLNLPILFFIASTLLSAFFSEYPYRTLQGATYYAVTGFLVSILIVNSLATEGFIALVVRTIALSSVVISLLNLAQVFVLNYTLTDAVPEIADKKLAQAYSWVFPTPGNLSEILAVYLLLGIPLLLSEVTQAKSRGRRDFWLICATISFVGIIFTQTRVGLFALLITGTIFFSRRLGQALSFLTLCLASVILLVALGSPKFAPSQIQTRVAEWVENKKSMLEAFPADKWLVGMGVAPTQAYTEEVDEDEETSAFYTTDGKPIKNMHLTLVLQQGILGWSIMMWLILSALWSMKKAYDKSKDDQIKTILWAIISSISGFLVSMNGINSFHHLTLQIFFWSLLGIGTAIVIRMNGHRRYNLIWRFGDAGD